MTPRISEININTARYWNGIYRKGQFPTNAQNNTHRYQAAAALQLGGTALDIGCGLGGLGKALALMHGGHVRYTGVDFSRAALRSTVYPEGTYRHRDWRTVTECADTVYVLELIEHVDDPAALLAKTASLATRRLVVGTPRYGKMSPALHRGEHQWDFTTDELAALLADHGTVGAIIPAGLECCVVGVDR